MTVSQEAKLDLIISMLGLLPDKVAIAKEVWNTQLPTQTVVPSNEWTDELGVVWVDESSNSWTSA